MLPKPCLKVEKCICQDTIGKILSFCENQQHYFCTWKMRRRGIVLGTCGALTYLFENSFKEVRKLFAMQRYPGVPPFYFKCLPLDTFRLMETRCIGEQKTHLCCRHDIYLENSLPFPTNNFLDRRWNFNVWLWKRLMSFSFQGQLYYSNAKMINYIILSFIFSPTLNSLFSFIICYTSKQNAFKKIFFVPFSNRWH